MAREIIRMNYIYKIFKAQEMIKVILQNQYILKTN